MMSFDENLERFIERLRVDEPTLVDLVRKSIHDALSHEFTVAFTDRGNPHFIVPVQQSFVSFGTLMAHGVLDDTSRLHRRFKEFGLDDSSALRYLSKCCELVSGIACEPLEGNTSIIGLREEHRATVPFELFLRLRAAWFPLIDTTAKEVRAIFDAHASKVC